jgi:hypothetical protein
VTHKFLGHTALSLGNELRSRSLKVVLVDAPYHTAWQGQRLRSVEDKNPKWYSEMYTGDGFRRYRVLPAIGRVASATDRRFYPDRRNSPRLEFVIRSICLRRLTLGFKEEADPTMEGFVYGSNLEVCEELGLEPVEGDDYSDIANLPGEFAHHDLALLEDF